MVKTKNNKRKMPHGYKSIFWSYELVSCSIEQFSKVSCNYINDLIMKFIQINFTHLLSAQLSISFFKNVISLTQSFIFERKSYHTSKLLYSQDNNEQLQANDF